MTPPHRIHLLGGLALTLGAVLIVMRLASPPPLRIGLLHSLSGHMAASERSLLDAELLAIAEINARGGVRGRTLEAVVADGQSDAGKFGAAARHLIRADDVKALFGVWRSADRKEVKRVVEEENGLLFYPLQHEGMEESGHVIYLGATPNQQIIPALRWVLGTIGRESRRIFLVGSDYVFPRAANEIIRVQAAAWGATIVGEEYLPVGSRAVTAVVRNIARALGEADAGHHVVVLNTLNGDVNVDFFRELRQVLGADAARVPVVSFSLAEDQLRQMPAAEIVGHYAAWTYFQSVRSTENLSFINAFKKAYGRDRVTDDPIVTAYMSVLLWARGVELARTTDVEKVRETVRGLSLASPGGMLYLDPDNLHAWKTVLIGQINAHRQFDVRWTSPHPVAPEVYPKTRRKEDWEGFLSAFHRQWGGKWENSGVPAGARD